MLRRSEIRSGMEQVPHPYIPDHPLRSRFVGRWHDRGQLAYDIGTDDAGQVRFHDINFNGWRVVINQVEWDGDALCFDQYHYAPQAHPFNGVRNAFRISVGETDGELKFVTEAPEIGQTATGVLRAE